MNISNNDEKLQSVTLFLQLTIGITAGGLCLFLPETKGCRMLETIEEAEEFYKTGKIKEKYNE